MSKKPKPEDQALIVPGPPEEDPRVRKVSSKDYQDMMRDGVIEKCDICDGWHHNQVLTSCVLERARRKMSKF